MRGGRNVAPATGSGRPQMKVRDTAARIHGDLATANEHLAQLFAPALDTRFHARQGNAGLSSGVRLGQASEGCEFDSCPVRLGQAPDHAGQTRCEFGFSERYWFRDRLGWEVSLQRIGAAISTLPGAQGVTESIPGDLKQPGLRPIGRSQGPDLANDAEEYILEKVVRIDARRNSPREERP